MGLVLFEAQLDPDKDAIPTFLQIFSCTPFLLIAYYFIYFNIFLIYSFLVFQVELRINFQNLVKNI